MKRIFQLTQDKRSPFLNSVLGGVCAFIAGSINAGGFIILGQYTSHITGVVASAADAIVLHQMGALARCLGFVLGFFLGAFCATLLIQWAEKLKLHSCFALAFFASAIVLIGLGLWTYLNGMSLHKDFILALGFFFSMGIQNATVTRLSHYEIRATHMTGVVTDLAIELGEWIFHHQCKDLQKLKRLLLIFVLFFIGGISGALSFKSQLGMVSLFFYGGILAILAIFPIYRDTHIRLRLLKRVHFSHH